MNDEIFDIVFSKDDISWQSMLYTLVKGEGMDPWDVDVSKLTKRYIDMLKKFKEMNFHVSGKVVLAAAILLKIKSIKLVSDDMSELDSLIQGEPEPSQDQFYDELEGNYGDLQDWTKRPDLIPKTPQPRQRKVSIYDLVSALQKALEVRHRRMLRHMPRGRLEVPEKKIDITKVMEQVYDRIIAHFASQQKLTYQELVKDVPRHELFGDIEIKKHTATLPPPEAVA